MERPSAAQNALRLAARPLARLLGQAEAKLAAEITHLTWTADGLLRHTGYIGLQEDKPVMDVRREA
jgi:hypothetical protein